MQMLKMAQPGVIPITKQSRCKWNVSLELMVGIRSPQSWVSSERLPVTPTRVRNIPTISLLCTDIRKFPNERAGNEVRGSHRQKERGEGKAGSHCGNEHPLVPQPTHRLLECTELRSIHLCLFVVVLWLQTGFYLFTRRLPFIKTNRKQTNRQTNRLLQQFSFLFQFLP